jgi:hypothetical protein
VLISLPGLLVSRKMLLLSMLFGNAVGMRAGVL